MANPYLQGAAQGVLQAMQLYEDKKAREAELGLRQQQLGMEQSRLGMEERRIGLAERQWEEGAPLREANARLVGANAAKAEYETSPEYLAQQRSDKETSNAYQRSLVDYNKTLGRIKEEELKRQDDARKARVRFFSSLAAAANPIAQRINAKFSSGQPLTQEEQDAALQFMSAPELLSRVGNELSGKDLAAYPSFQKQLAGIGEVKGDSIKLKNGKTIPLDQLTFTVASAPKASLVRDEKGNVAVVMDMDLASNQFPDVVISHRAPATEDKTASPSSKVKIMSPEEFSQNMKKRYEDMGAMGTVAKFMVDNNIPPEDMAIMMETDPQFMKIFGNEEDIDSKAMDLMKVVNASADIRNHITFQEAKAMLTGQQKTPTATSYEEAKKAGWR